MIGPLITQERADRRPLHTATRLPASHQDVSDAAYEFSIYNNNSYAKENSYNESIDRAFKPHVDSWAAQEEAAGFPRREAPSTAVIGEIYSQVDPVKRDEYSKILGRPVKSWSDAYYVGHRLQVDPNSELSIPTYEEIQAGAADIANKTAEEFAMEQAFAITPSARTSGSLVGGLRGAFADPVNLAATIGTLPMAITRSVFKTAMAEAIVNASAEAVIQGEVADWYEEIGREYTSQDFINNVSGAALFGGVFGGGMSGVYRVLGGQNTALFANAAAKQPGLDPHNPWLDPARYAQEIDLIARTNLLPENFGRQQEVIKTTAKYADNDLSVLGVEYTYKGLENPFQQHHWSLSTNMYRIAENAPTRELRVAALAEASDFQIAATNPYRAQPRPGWDLDSIVYTAGKTELDAAHRSNISAAIRALHDGTPLDVPDKEALNDRQRCDHHASQPYLPGAFKQAGQPVRVGQVKSAG